MKRSNRKSGAMLEAGRTPRLLALFLLMLLTSGCATKRDLRDLRTEVAALQQRQDSMLQAIYAQQLMLMDTATANRELLLRTRGDLARQMLQMEEQLVQIQELAGQSQRRLSELRQDYERRAEQIDQPATGGVSPGGTPGMAAAPAPSGSGNDPEQLYQVGREQLERGNARTARQAFEMLLTSNSGHRLAPDAQFGIAESWVQEDAARALREFERVQELFPSSPRAPAALYRAGVVARDRANDSGRAREYFQRVVRGYPGSEEARAASEALGRLRD